MRLKKLLLLFLLLPIIVTAQITDYASLFSDQQKTQIDVAIFQSLNRDSVQIAIVLVKTLGNVSIEDYALQYGRTHHVGTDRRGLVFVVSVDDHLQRLEVGENLQGIITDVQSKILLDNNKAFFKSGQYYEGILAMLRSLDALLKIDPNAKSPIAEMKQSDDLIYTLIFCVLIAAFLWWMILYIRRKMKPSRDEIADSMRSDYNPFGYRMEFGHDVEAIADPLRYPLGMWRNPIPTTIIADINDEPGMMPPPQTYYPETPVQPDTSSSSNSDYSSSSNSDSSSSSSDYSSSSDSGSGGFDGGGASSNF